MALNASHGDDAARQKHERDEEQRRKDQEEKASRDKADATERRAAGDAEQNQQRRAEGEQLRNTENDASRAPKSDDRDSAAENALLKEEKQAAEEAALKWWNQQIAARWPADAAHPVEQERNTSIRQEAEAIAHMRAAIERQHAKGLFNTGEAERDVAAMEAKLKKDYGAISPATEGIAEKRLNTWRQTDREYDNALKSGQSEKTLARLDEARERAAASLWNNKPLREQAEGKLARPAESDKLDRQAEAHTRKLTQDQSHGHRR